MQTMAQRQAEFRRAQLAKHPTHWPADLAPDAKRVLEAALYSGQRLRIFSGDTATGKAWPEEWHTVGTVNRTMGAGPSPVRAAMLVSTGSNAGSPFSGSIVAILTAPGVFAYRHPSFDPGVWAVRATATAEHSAEYPFESTCNGEVHGRHKTRADAERVAAFMRGDRMSPRRYPKEQA